MIVRCLCGRGVPLLTAAAMATGPFVTPAQAVSPVPARPGAAAPASFSPDLAHIKVLSAVLRAMRNNFATFAGVSPGPQDIFDYNIGSPVAEGH